MIMGAPGAGKGTQAKLLEERRGVAHISTGDILRDARRAGTTLGREAERFMAQGLLVPDDVVIGIVADRLAAQNHNRGFLLDGFPRTIEQAEALAGELEKLDRRLTATLLIDVPDDLVVQRLSGRRVSRKTGRVYHVDNDPPKHEGRCDIDGSQLVQRKDDEEATVRKRLAVYHEQTAPLIDYYEDRGLLRRFDGTRGPSEVHDHIRATLATLRLEEQL